MPQTKTFCNYDGSFYSQSQKFSREQDLVALGSLARRSAISWPLCLQYYKILLGEGQSPLYKSLKRHNKEQPIGFCICHTHKQYRGSIICFQKNLTSLHCRTIISSRYIREPRMLSSIRSQSKKNRIENFSLTQYDTRVLTPTKVVFTLYLRLRNEFQPFPITLLFYF